MYTLHNLTSNTLFGHYNACKKELELGRMIVATLELP